MTSVVRRIDGDDESEGAKPSTNVGTYADFERNYPGRRRMRYGFDSPRLARFLAGTPTTTVESKALVALMRAEGDEHADYLSGLVSLWREAGVWNGRGSAPERGDLINYAGVCQYRCVGVGDFVVMTDRHDDFDATCVRFDHFRSRELAGESIDVSYFLPVFTGGEVDDLDVDVPSELPPHDRSGKWGRTRSFEDGSCADTTWRVDLPLTQRGLERARRLRDVARDLVARTADFRVARHSDDALVRSVVRALLVAIGPVSSLRQIASWFGFEVRGVLVEGPSAGIFGTDIEGSTYSYLGFEYMDFQDRGVPCLAVPLRVEPTSEEWREHVTFAIGQVVANWIGCDRQFHEEHLWAARVGRMIVVPDEVIAPAMITRSWFPLEIGEDGDYTEESLGAAEDAGAAALELEVAKVPRRYSSAMARKRLDDESETPGITRELTRLVLDRAVAA